MSGGRPSCFLPWAQASQDHEADELEAAVAASLAESSGGAGYGGVPPASGDTINMLELLWAGFAEDDVLACIREGLEMSATTAASVQI